MSVKKTTRSRTKKANKNPMADLLAQSLDNHNKNQSPVAIQAAQKPMAVKKLTQQQPGKDITASQASVVAPRGAGKLKTRQTVILNGEDQDIITRVGGALVGSGHYNLSVSKILKTALRLMPDDNTTVVAAYEAVLAEDMRLKKS